MPIQPLDHLRESLAVFRKHPVALAALGLALVLSVFLVPCGLGLVALPWFGAELYAFQVAAATGGAVRRRRSWFSAGVFILTAAVLVVAAAAVSSLGAHFRGEEAFSGLPRLALGVAGFVLAALFVMPFTYAPRILVDRGGSLGGAALESARFFIDDGALGHVAAVFLAHFVQASPLIIASALGVAIRDPSVVPFLLLGAVPFLAVTVPVGQGVITAAWVARRDRLVDASQRRPAGRPPAAVTVPLALCWVSPAVAVTLVIASLANPAPLERVDIGGSDLPAGWARAGEVLVDESIGDRPRVIVVPDTALTLEVDGAVARVVASDGGGVGELPLGAARGSPVDNVRIARRHDLYVVDLTTAAGRFRATVDRAGVRRGDDLSRRLAGRVPPWGLVVLALGLFVVPLALTGVVAALAELRRSSALAPAELSDEALIARRRRTLRAAALSTLAIAPIAIGTLAVGVRALL